MHRDFPRSPARRFAEYLEARLEESDVPLIVALDGVYSGRPELADAVDLRILLKPDEDERRKRLCDREGEDYDSDWERRWADVEEYYFRHVVTEADYALVL